MGRVGGLGFIFELVKMGGFYCVMSSKVITIYI